ncbi:MAG TPA: rhodanese-like domain-containing protein [Pyrinomonadaceae bacterium]
MRLFFSLSAVALAAVLMTACGSTNQVNQQTSSNAGASNGANAVKQPTVSTSTAQTPSTASTPIIITPPATPDDGVRRITTVELRDALSKGTAIVVDVRSADTYKQNHIKGSINIPAAQVASRLDELPRDKMIVTYCS